LFFWLLFANPEFPALARWATSSNAPGSLERWVVPPAAAADLQFGSQSRRGGAWFTLLT
jgi:hypothetical protein